MTKDIEREAFEEFVRIEYPVAANTVLEKYDDGYLNNEIAIAWEFWKKRAEIEKEKLEGCVVVPVEMPDSFNDATTDYFNDTSEGENYDAFVKLVDIDNKSIWAMAVEAARGGND